MKNKKFLLLSFFIPLIIYLFFFYINGLLTNRMILIGDSYEQYYPLFHYLKGILEGTNSIFYSFSKSIGGSMFGTFFYYLSSPLNLLVGLIKDQYILDFMTYLTIFKLSVCGLTMYIYMSKKFKTNSYILLIFSILYSLSGYNLNYFLNIMWLDVIALAPIVLLGIDKIIENKSPLLYMITLTLCIYSNYYLSYMLCLFSVLYFIYEILLKYNFKKNKKEIIKISKKFIISSLLSGVMCSFFLIPCILEMLGYGRIAPLDKIFIFDYNIFNLLANTYMGSVDTTHPFNTYSINLYCGIIIFPLLYLYFRNKNIDKKEKILSGLLITFMILPCFIGPLNFVWHLFTIPIGYNYRYSFLLILFLLRLAYKSYNNYSISKVNILEYLSVFVSYSVIIIYILYFKNYYPYLNYIQIWLSNLFLISYLIILYKIKNKKILNKLIFVLILVESVINVGIVLDNDDFFTRDKLEYKYEYLEKYETDKRITSAYNPNNTLVTNDLGVNIFLSSKNESIYTLAKIGHNSNPPIDMNYFILARNHSYIFNSLFSNKFIVTDSENPNYNTLEDITIKGEKSYILNNSNALNLGYIVKNNCNDLEFTFPYDEKVLNCILGEENKFYNEITYKKDNNKITYKTNQEYYFVYMPDISEKIDYFEKIYGLGNEMYIIDKDYIFIKNIDKFDEITLEIESGNIDKFKLYYFNYDLFNEKIQNLKNTEFNYIINKNKMIAKVNSEGGLLLLTIPYENGIQIKVDEEIINHERVLDTLIGINIKPGTHEIKITYNQPGLIIGNIISILSIIITFIYIKRY